MKIRVITLKQPWASLVANGLKTYEFRNMNYSYRGKIFIHAGKGVDKEALKGVEEYIYYYNNERPSYALNYKTPIQYKIESGF